MSDLTDLDIRFQEALHKASLIDYPLPPDVRLKLYAFYKQVTKEPINSKSVGEHELVNAFKLNAWMQVRSISVEEAKEGYISLINELYSKM